MISDRETDTAIRQIEFDLEKAEARMAFQYDAERVGQIRHMLVEARKRKRGGWAGDEGKRMTSTLTNIAVAVARLAIFVSWFTVISSRGLLMNLVASVAFGGAAALLITAARSLADSVAEDQPQRSKFP